MRPHLKTILIAIVTIALVAWFLRQANFAEVWREIRSARVSLLVTALVMTAATYLLRAFRWQFLLAPLGGASFRQAFRTTVIGFAANTVLPARVGEVVRPYLLARREGLSVTATFATIILERLLDLVSVLLLFGLFVFLFDPGMATVNPGIYQTLKTGGIVLALAAILALVLVALVSRHADWVRSAVDRLARVLPGKWRAKLVHLGQRFIEGLGVIRDPLRLLQALALSLPLWLSIASGIWFTSAAFHMTMPFTGSFLIMALLVVGVAVPTPGAVGGFHEAFRIGATTFYGVANDRAVGAAIVLHAMSFVPVTLLGAWFMLQDGLNLSGVQRLGEEARAVEGRDSAEPVQLEASSEGTRG